MRRALSAAIDNFWLTVLIVFATTMIALFSLPRPAKAQTQCHTSCIYVGDTPYCTTTCY